MPRAYRLGRRAETHAATRARIVRAALGLYKTGGFAAATTGAVAAAADVAPATVRNHFPTPRELAVVAGEAVLGDLRPPDPSIFDGLSSTRERIETLIRELVSFLERSGTWWDISRRDPVLSEAWAGAAATYERGFDAVIKAGLGPLAEDPTAVAVTATIAGPTLHYALRATGLSSEQAMDAQVGLILPWLEERSSAGRRRKAVRAGG